MTLTLENVLVAYLTASQSAPIMPFPLPKGQALPAITFQNIPGGEHIQTHGGILGTYGGRYQLDVWGNSHYQARQSADLAITAIGNWTGTASYVNDDYGLYEPDTQLHRVIIDCEFWRNS